MKKSFFIYFFAIAIVLTGCSFPANNNQETNSTNSNFNKSENSNSREDSDEEKVVVSVGETQEYQLYTEQAFAAAADKKRVIFFHANWCPTCRVADRNIGGNLDLLPSDVVIFRADFDTDTALKKTYSVVNQHTFVYVDSDGDSVNQWVGGDIDQIIKRTS